MSALDLRTGQTGHWPQGSGRNGERRKGSAERGEKKERNRVDSHWVLNLA